MLLPDNCLVAGIEAAPDEGQIAFVIIEEALIPEAGMIRIRLLKDIAPSTSITSYVHKRNSLTLGSAAGAQPRQRQVLDESRAHSGRLHPAVMVQPLVAAARAQRELIQLGRKATRCGNYAARISRKERQIQRRAGGYSTSMERAAEP